MSKLYNGRLKKKDGYRYYFMSMVDCAKIWQFKEEGWLASSFHISIPPELW